MHSLFSDVIVTINDEIVEGGNKTYAIEAMISTLFSFSQKFGKTSYLQLDESGKMDNVTGR